MPVIVAAPLLAVLGLSLLIYRAGGVPPWPPSWPRLIASVGAAALAVGLAIQLVPYGRSHANPPVTGEPPWDSPRTRELARVACFDCHSNEVEWPWYTNVAPVSWLITSNVEQGRDELNFSEWDRPQEEAGEAVETVEERSMPPAEYGLLHAAARLSADERTELARGLRASLGVQGRDGDEDSDDDDD